MDDRFVWMIHFCNVLRLVNCDTACFADPLGADWCVGAACVVTTCATSVYTILGLGQAQTVRFCVFSIDFHPSPPTCFNPVILLHKVIRSLEPPSPGNSNLSGSSKRPNPKAGLSDTISSNNGDGNSTSGSSTQPIPSTSSSRIDAAKPFAERMRPQTLSEYVGQSDVVNGPLKMLLAQGRIPSMILWGPPGTGKTTLARLVVKSASSSSSSDPPPHRFVEISATNSGTADVKKIMDQALHRLSLTGQPTVLFIDEIQRFTRAQQDVFLPAVEKGHIVLVGATTENPSFRLQSALISRMRVFVLTKLSVDECCQVLRNALTRIQQEEADPRTSRIVSHIDSDLIRWTANMSDRDARTALSALELALSTTDASLSATSNVTSLKKALKRTAFQYDRTGNMHYDTISALHKSIRGSDPDGALYWLARMVCSGDDPLFIARRLIIAASEDVDGLQALQMATASIMLVRSSVCRSAVRI